MKVQRQMKFWFIKRFASEIGYEVEELENNSARIGLSKSYAVEFVIRLEENGDIHWFLTRGKPVSVNSASYSISSATDAIRFCNYIEECITTTPRLAAALFQAHYSDKK